MNKIEKAAKLINNTKKAVGLVAVSLSSLALTGCQSVKEVLPGAAQYFQSSERLDMAIPFIGLSLALSFVGGVLAVNGGIKAVKRNIRRKK